MVRLQIDIPSHSIPLRVLDPLPYKKSMTQDTSPFSSYQEPSEET